jgi:hypothetical protein
MAKVKIQGHASGTGILTVTAPNTSTDRTITLPDATGTLAITTDDDDKLPLAGGTMTGAIVLNSTNLTAGDSTSTTNKIRLGASNDLNIHHDGSNSYIEDSGTGALRILGSQIEFRNPADSEAMMIGAENGAITLYHDNSAKLATSATGVSILPTTAREAKIRVEDEGTDDAVVLSSYHASNGNLREVGLEGWKIRMYTGDEGGTSSVRGFEMDENRHCTFWNTGNTVPTNEAVHHIINNNNTQTFMVDSTKTSGFTNNTMKIQNSQDSSNSSYNQLEVRNGGGAVLRILDGGNVINSNNSYGQISDERVKQDIADASSQWDDIKALKVRKFKLKREVNKDSDSAAFQIGVIAQEVASSGMSGLVSEERPNEEDVVLHSDFGTVVAGTADNGATPIKDEEGNVTGYEDLFTEGEKVKSIKYSVLYMKAIKALQEAMDRIETLEAKVTTLENK